MPPEPDLDADCAVLFTSGATESCNAAIFGAVRANPDNGFAQAVRALAYDWSATEEQAAVREGFLTEALNAAVRAVCRQRFSASLCESSSSSTPLTPSQTFAFLRAIASRRSRVTGQVSTVFASTNSGASASSGAPPTRSTLRSSTTTSR